MGRLKVYDFIPRMHGSLEYLGGWRAYEYAKHLRPLFTFWCAIRPKPLNREAQTVDPKLETRSLKPQTLNSRL